MFVIVVAISQVTTAAAYDASRRERRRRASIGVSQTAHFPPRNRGVPVPLAISRLHWEKFQAVPAKKKLNWKKFQPIPARNRLYIDWSEVDRAMRGLGNVDKPNPTPVRRLGLSRVLDIDRSVGHEEMWIGKLDLDVLSSQNRRSFVLGDHGEDLQCQLHELDSNHHLLTAEAHTTLSGQYIRDAISTHNALYRRLKRSVGSVPVGYQVSDSDAILSEYRMWWICADAFSTAIAKLTAQN